MKKIFLVLSFFCLFDSCSNKQSSIISEEHYDVGISCVVDFVDTVSASAQSIQQNEYQINDSIYVRFDFKIENATNHDTTFVFKVTVPDDSNYISDFSVAYGNEITRPYSTITYFDQTKNKNIEAKVIVLQGYIINANDVIHDTVIFKLKASNVCEDYYLSGVFSSEDNENYIFKDGMKKFVSPNFSIYEPIFEE